MVRLTEKKEGLVVRGLACNSKDVGSIPCSAIGSMCDLRQVTYSFCASVLHLSNGDNSAARPHRVIVRINILKDCKVLRFCNKGVTITSDQ